MPRSTSEEVKEKWKETIHQQRQSGLSITAWCCENNISKSVFCYWRDKLFPKVALNHTAFTELFDKKSSIQTGIKLEYQGFRIHLEGDFDPYTLKKCLDVLKKC